MSQPVLRVAAKAVIFNDQGQVLILRESGSYVEGTQVGRWGIPGGRIESGEAFYDGLQREVSEETGLSVEPIQPLYVGEWRPVIRGIEHQIIAMFLACKVTSGEITLSRDHDDFKWINPDDHAQYDIVDPEDEVLRAFRDWFTHYVS